MVVVVTVDGLVVCGPHQQKSANAWAYLRAYLSRVKGRILGIHSVSQRTTRHSITESVSRYLVEFGVPFIFVLVPNVLSFLLLNSSLMQKLYLD